MRRLRARQAAATPQTEFREAGEKLDAVLGVSEDDGKPRTRVSQANFVRAPGTKVAWPEAPPASWRSKHSDEIRKGEL